MKTPAEAFIDWFESISPRIRAHLAHMFRVLTTEDTSVMAGERQVSLIEFRAWLVKPDFPLRLAARMFHVRSVFDMVILHHREILRDGQLGGSKDIQDISPRLWQAAAESWGILRQKELADSYIHTWASWVIGLQMEKA